MTLLPRQSTNSVSSKLSFAPNLPKSSSIRSRLSSSLSLFNARGSVTFHIGKDGFKVPRYQNTYQLNSFNPLSSIVVDNILKNVMIQYLNGINKYDCEICSRCCEEMSEEIRTQLHRQNFDRYKYIVLMTIHEKCGQGITNKYGCLWNNESDSCSNYVYESSQFFSIGFVAGVYYE